MLFPSTVRLTCEEQVTLDAMIHRGKANARTMAEIEIGIFQRSCLQRRLGDEQQLSQQVAALQAERNAKHCTISWQFTAGDARAELQPLYPKS